MTTTSASPERPRRRLVHRAGQSASTPPAQAAARAADLAARQAHDDAVLALVDRAYARGAEPPGSEPTSLAARIPYDRARETAAVLAAHDPADGEDVLADALTYVEGGAAERTIASAARDLVATATINRAHAARLWRAGYGEGPDYVQTQAEDEAIAAAERLLAVPVRDADVVAHLLDELRAQDAPKALIDAVTRLGVRV